MNFDFRKKEDQVAQIWVMGVGGLGNSGNAQKKTFFFQWISSLSFCLDAKGVPGTISALSHAVPQPWLFPPPRRTMESEGEGGVQAVCTNLCILKDNVSYQRLWAYGMKHNF